MIGRRGFLRAMLAACAAPAIVRSGILMPVKQIIVPPWIGLDLGEGASTLVTGVWNDHRWSDDQIQALRERAVSQKLVLNRLRVRNGRWA